MEDVLVTEELYHYHGQHFTVEISISVMEDIAFTGNLYLCYGGHSSYTEVLYQSLGELDSYWRTT